jgi:cytochrome c oxidase cbb3-type subunit III
MRIVSAIALIAALGLLGVTAGCGGAEDQPQLPDQVTDFNLLFGQNCSGCHGADGKQGAGPQLNSAVYQAVIDKEQLLNIISKGRPGTPMLAFAKSAGGTLTDRQIDALATEMQKRWGQPDRFTGAAMPPYAAAGAGDVQHGAMVYRIRCLACHGVEGRGGTIAGSIIDPSYLGLASDQLLRTTVIIGRPSNGMPDFLRSGKPIPAQDITDVVAWLVSHRTQPAPLSAATPAQGGTTP